jgi:hypothetical protein
MKRSNASSASVTTLLALMTTLAVLRLTAPLPPASNTMAAETTAAKAIVMRAQF